MDQRADFRGLARDAAHHLPQIDIAIGLERIRRKLRQRAVRRIADHAQRGERQAMCLGITRGDMAFHIECIGAGGCAQRRLADLSEHDFFHAGENAIDHVAAALHRQRDQHLG